MLSRWQTLCREENNAPVDVIIGIVRAKKLVVQYSGEDALRGSG
jgi:hypothetical protein